MEQQDDFALVDDIVDLEDVAYSENQDGYDSAVGALVSQPLSTSSISDNQERVLSILLMVSATLSILGSAFIIFKIRRDRQLSKPYHRIMVALSISDVIASFTFGLYPFLMPKGVRVWSAGNEATCTALGFFTQLSFGAVGYNCILSFYYLMVVRYNMKRKRFSQKYERPMHFVNLVFFLTTASSGAANQFYSPVDIGFGCWVNDFPKGCDQSGDCVSQTIAIIFAGIPLFLSFLVTVINNLIVYFHVRNIFNTLKKVSSVGASNDSSRQIRPSSATETDAVRLKQISKRSELYDEKLSEVAFQGFMYVGSFLICYTPALATRLVETFTYNYDDSKVYWLLVITAMTLPLQGFFNMFIYNRPHYVKIRDANPHMGVLQSMYAAFVESKSLITSSSKNVNSRLAAVGSGLEVVVEERSKFSFAGKHFPKRGNLSTLTMSVGDFDHVIDRDAQDERWRNNSDENLLSWVPIRRSRHIMTSSSGNRGSSLEVISETTEFVFEPFPPPHAAFAKEDEQLPPAELTEVNAGQKEDRWSPVSSPAQRIRKGVSISARIQNSENGPLSSILPLPMRVESLNDDEEGQSPSISSSSDNNSQKTITSNGQHSASRASFTSSVDSPLMPPRRKLSPPRFVNNDDSYDDDSDDEEIIVNG